MGEGAENVRITSYRGEGI